MNQLTRYTALILIGLSIGLSAGCGKKTPQATAESEIASAVAKLAGAADVKSAMDNKDYEGAMATLLKVKATIATEDQQLQYTVLNHWVKDKLIDAAPTDPKAAEALTNLRALTIGR